MIDEQAKRPTLEEIAQWHAKQHAMDHSESRAILAALHDLQERIAIWYDEKGRYLPSYLRSDAIRAWGRKP